MSETAIQDNILNLWTVLNEFRLQGKFCDVRLQVGPELFQSHRFLLAAASEYFDAMFDGNFRERNVNESEPIPLQDIDAIAFRGILEFVYTGDVTVTDANVCNLLRASDFLQLRNSFVKNRCVEFIINCVRTTDQPITNAFETLSLAVVIKNKILINALSKHICTHLAHFSENINFLAIPFDEFNLVLDGKLVVSCSEDGFLKAILRWVDYSREERSKYRAQLMKKIDYKKISPDCMAFVLEEYEKRLDRGNLNEYSKCGHDEENEDTFLAACPVSDVSDESLHVYFTSGGRVNGNIEKAFTSDGCSFIRDVDNIGADGYKRFIALNGRQYLMISGSYLNTFYQYAPDKRVPLSPPPTMSQFDWCGVHNNIYLCEKFSRIPTSRSSPVRVPGVHVYNCDKNYWSTLPPILKQTFDNCITIHDNVVFVIGGLCWQGFSGICVQAYDLRTKVWRVLSNNLPLGLQYSGGNCCTFKGQVYVLDYNNRFEFFVFDPILEEWHLKVGLPDIHTTTWFRCVPYKNELWLFGTQLDIAIYNDTLDTKWRHLNSLKDLIGDRKVFLTDVVVI